MLLTLALALLGAPAASAGTILEDWAQVTVPPAPAAAAVTLDPRRTALLMLDFNGHQDAASGPCNAATKPRCLATLPAVRRLLDLARARGVFVVHSTSAAGTPADIRAEVAPRPDEPVVSAGPDKFIGTDLGALIGRRGLDTLVVVGTAAEGAVLDTATDAALHGYAVVVPVDGLSSTEPYAEQYVAWHLVHAPGLAQKARLTRIDAIGF
jgi:nicotinamidase-related amidase